MSKYHTGSLREIIDELIMCEVDEVPYHLIPKCCWIFSTASEAIRAMAWAKSAGHQIPQKISIICLENDPAYYSHNLTTCAYDWDRTGYLLAHALIADIAIAHTRKGFIKVQATIMQRGTTQ